MLKNRNTVPAFYSGDIPLATHQKAVDYNVEKIQFGFLPMAFNIFAAWALILTGFFNTWDDWITSWNFNGLHHSVAYALGLGLILMALQIPFSLYSTFVIEQKYGFNRMTFGLFVADTLKGLILMLLLGVPLLYLVFFIYSKLGQNWWWVAFLAVFGFELFISAVFPSFIMPLFNKFIPLEEGTLSKAIRDIADKVRFKMSGVFTMDGSKRSAHSNAFFAGMGKSRRIVLFDTLMTQLTEKEIVAVLAHEMGHNIRKHVQKGLALSFVVSLISFYVLGLLVNWEPFYAAFGAGAPAIHKAIVLFAIFSSSFTFWLTPISNLLSRKHEYEADAFSAEHTGDAASLISGLKKLSKDNLSNLTPHPLVSFWHHSHPTVPERASKMQAVTSLKS